MRYTCWLALILNDEARMLLSRSGSAENFTCLSCITDKVCEGEISLLRTGLPRFTSDLVWNSAWLVYKDSRLILHYLVV